MSNRTIACLAAILTVGIASAASQAATVTVPSRAETVSVSAHDLDLNTTYGRLIFKARIRSAARDVCGREEVVAMQNAGAVSSCFEATLEAAMTNANVLIASAQKRGAVALASR